MSGSSTPAVILAGGRATRMGGVDKPLLRLGGHAVLDHVLQGLRPQVGAIALNANGDPARFAAWGLPVLPDPEPSDGGPPQPGPLAGVLAAMLWAAPFATHVLTWPGDTPYPPPDLMARFAERPSAGVVCAASGGRLHPVVAIWPVALAGALHSFLRQQARRVADFARAADLTVVEWPGDSDPFLNLNTPADLTQAEAASRPV